MGKDARSEIKQKNKMRTCERGEKEDELSTVVSISAWHKAESVNDLSW